MENKKVCKKTPTARGVLGLESYMYKIAQGKAKAPLKFLQTSEHLLKDAHGRFTAGWVYGGVEVDGKLSLICYVFLTIQ